MAFISNGGRRILLQFESLFRKLGESGKHDATENDFISEAPDKEPLEVLRNGC